MELYYDGQLIMSFELKPEHTVSHIKQKIDQWLSPQGIYRDTYTIYIYSPDGTLLNLNDNYNLYDNNMMGGKIIVSAEIPMIAPDTMYYNQQLLTGINDIDRIILFKLDDKSLLNFCETNEYTQELCNDSMWENRYLKTFGELPYKPKSETWKEVYLKRRKPKTVCLKVASLRKEYNDTDVSLKKWMESSNNLYVGRAGRIFITNPNTKNKEIFHYKGSKWQNPYKVGKGPGKYSLAESLRLYREHIINSGLINDISELAGKTLGCFCDQSGECHAKVLVELYEQYS